MNKIYSSLRMKITHFFFKLFFTKLEVNLQANEQIKITKQHYYSSGSHPFFDVSFKKGGLSRWARFCLSLQCDFPISPDLYFDCGTGFSELDKITLAIDIDGKIDCLLRIPDGCEKIRFVPMKQKGNFNLQSFKCYQVSKYTVILFFLYTQMPVLVNQLISRQIWAKHKALYHIRYILVERLSNGVNLLDKPLLNDTSNYGGYIRLSEQLLSSQLEEYDFYPAQLNPEFLLMIILADYDPVFIEKLKKSLQVQSYPHWQSIVISANNELLLPLFKNDPRFKFFETDTVSTSQQCNQLISYSVKHCSSKEQIIVFPAAGVLLNPMALSILAATYSKNSSFKVAYADEDSIDSNGKHFNPVFKPDWDPFLLRSQNYFGGLTAYEANFFIQLGGLQQPVDLFAYWELALRASRFLKSENIVHIPVVLSYRDEENYCSGEIMKSPNTDKMQQILSQHLEKSGSPVVQCLFQDEGFYRFQYKLKEKPLVSIIIPTKNGYQILKQCIASIIERSSYSHYEIIVVDNQSDETKTLDYLESLSHQNNIRLIPYDKPFNYSAINNTAAEYARGDILLFLNNDIEVINSEWLSEMVQLALLPKVGAVGAKLLFPDDLIQHAGVILGYRGVAGHIFSGLKNNLKLPLGRLQVVQSYSAVTAACLAVKKIDFLSVGGFNEAELAVAFNDIDLCLKLQQSGLINLWTPHAKLYHYESLSRGYENSPEKQARFNNEITYMKKNWQSLLQHDPMYNENLSLESLEFQLATQTRYVL
ncbi:MAG: glycosyltransferase family 2 protein [gamma proteobacterium symbiont of Taylorina sp.]|nr:glycosyltransferase family 2 protein [gamma proteobacterium symbiont of Taylorina sp.]